MRLTYINKLYTMATDMRAPKQRFKILALITPPFADRRTIEDRLQPLSINRTAREKQFLISPNPPVAGQ
jgi:hypothetical protein